MPDKLITSVPLIQRYSRHNERADWSFRNYFKHRLNVSNQELDAVVRDATDLVWKQIDCTECANCCKTLRIVVDSADIARLARGLGLSAREFAQRYIRSDEYGEKFFARSPCPFLGSDNRCTVYDERPAACRDYPYLYEKDFRSRSLTMYENVSSCPIVFNVWQELKERFGRKGQGR